MFDNDIEKKIIKICNNNFPKLNVGHKQLLIPIIKEIIIEIKKMFNISDSDCLKQFSQNKGRDILGIIILLLLDTIV